MMPWFDINLSQACGIIFTTIVMFFLLMLFIKLNGLRSFAKLSSHDFAVTIAIGSILGAITIQKEPSLLHGALAIMVFLVLQSLYSKWRMHRSYPYLENEPLLLMDGKQILDDNLTKAKITREDLYAKLREANVLQLSQVQAVVLETSGDISVLHGSEKIDEVIMTNVRTTI